MPVPVLSSERAADAADAEGAPREAAAAARSHGGSSRGAASTTGTAAAAGPGRQTYTFETSEVSNVADKEHPWRPQQGGSCSAAV